MLQARLPFRNDIILRRRYKMEKFPNSTEENSNAKQWFAGVQEELAKERAKTQEDYNNEN